jgi:capsular exopolysaccharide synthesis family protein
MNPLKYEDIRQKEVELLVQNQALMVKSPHVLLKVLDDSQVRQTQWYKWAREQEDEKTVDLLADIVFATPVRDTNFLRVGVTWRVPAEVATLANTVVRKYLDRVNELQKSGIRESREHLGKELNSATARLEAKRREIETLRGTEEVLGAGEGGPSEALLTIQALVEELNIEMLGREAQWERLRQRHAEDLSIPAELQALLAIDPEVLAVQNRLQVAEENLGLLSARYGKNHPVVKNASAARDVLRGSMSEQRAEKLLQYQKELIDQAHRNYTEATYQLLKLKERLFDAQAEQRDRDTKYARYLRLLEEQDMLKLQHQAMQEQESILTMTLGRETAVQIDVPSSAKPPKRRSSPDWFRWMLAGAFLGLTMSVGLAFLLELADKSVRTPRDVPRMPVLGTIPTTDDDEVEIERAETASIDAPHSILAEAFRNLRANLFFSAPAEQQGVILVTSPSGGNGKTTVAVNLGISIALNGRRVLLIDANFRRPGLPRLFPGVPEQGLSNILIGQVSVGDLAVSTAVPGLDVLGPGPAPPNPAELLGSSYLRDVVVDARSRYDQVIFDGPPVLLVSDAMVLAGAVDGVLIVCEYRTTSRGAMQRTQRQLEAIDARVFGAVLNRVQTRAGGYFRKIYREFYEYQEIGDRGIAAPQSLTPGPQSLTPDPQSLTPDPQSLTPDPQSLTPDPQSLTPDPQSPAPDPRPPIPDEVVGGVLDLDEELKFDDNFDLGEDFDEPDEPKPGGGKSG